MKMCIKKIIQIALVVAAFSGCTKISEVMIISEDGIGDAKMQAINAVQGTTGDAVSNVVTVYGGG